MSIVATSEVPLTYLVDLTVTPAGFVVPVLKNVAFAPLLNPLPLTVTFKPVVA